MRHFHLFTIHRHSFPSDGNHKPISTRFSGLHCHSWGHHSHG